jgi:hypothetical protein
VFGGWIKLARFGWVFALACWCLGMDKIERLNKYTMRGEVASSVSVIFGGPGYC